MTEAKASQSARAGTVETAVVVIAVLSACVLSFTNLGKPSLWHDELIHVYVGKEILESGKPLLISGKLFTNGTIFNYLLAGVIAIFGDGEAAVRSLSAVFGVANILLTYRLLRPLIGGPAAAISALLLAWSPWQLAWARQARFYMLHQTVYLVMLWCVWRFGEAQSRRALVWWGAAITGCYVLGLLAGPQTVFFLGPIGAYALCLCFHERKLRTRWTALIVICGTLGAGTLLGYYLALPKAEHDAIFREALKTDIRETDLVDRDQTDSLYYFRFYTLNLGSGFFVLACAGFAMLAWKRDRRALLVLLAFVVPLLVLNFGIAYKRYRFLFFAYPFYVAACGFALVHISAFVHRARASTLRMLAAALLLVFSARLAVSQYRLAADCVEIARGGNSTLATHHPQWRQPCHYVRERADGDVVVCTTYITALYYVGRVDNWYPSRIIVWETIESGMEGLKSLEDFKAYVAAHPSGFFIAEHRRFHHWPFFAEDLAWVESNLTRVEAASNSDMTVYAWGGAEK